MKASELRIGNLIYWDVPEKANTSHEVVGIVKGKPQTVPISLGDSIEDYKPIPLTEEWLVRFGFEKPAHSWIGDIFHLSEWDAFPLNWCVAMNKNNAIIFLKLKYVHQLQNLYFALAGEELEMKKQ